VYNVMTKPDRHSVLLDNSKDKIYKSKVDIGISIENNSVLDCIKKNSLLKTGLNLEKEHEEEVAKFNKEKKEFEKNMKEKKEQFESWLEEEQNKLQKEQYMFCRKISLYLRESRLIKEQATKQQREEINALKQQVIKF